MYHRYASVQVGAIRTRVHSRTHSQVHTAHSRTYSGGVYARSNVRPHVRYSRVSHARACWRGGGTRAHSRAAGVGVSHVPSARASLLRSQFEPLRLSVGCARAGRTRPLLSRGRSRNVAWPRRLCMRARVRCKWGVVRKREKERGEAEEEEGGEERVREVTSPPPLTPPPLSLSLSLSLSL